MSQDPTPHAPGVAPMTRLPLDFAAFHQLHRPNYVRYARTFLRNMDDAEEAADATFEQLLHKWPQVLASDNPHAYAWRVLRNKIIDHCRARDRRPPLIDTAVFETRALHASTDPITQVEESLALFRAIGELSDRQQDVAVLHYLHGLTADEVADELGVTAATVRSTARHARRRLRDLLTPDSDHEGHLDDRS
ncbi:RNA polymerase sigma factor [Streptomyces sp. NPDC101062]|uniref:RNA polymerase sigma factor n=1 Tax=unclassified Streptomyces TaxID=2593676 RepID=UPI00380F9CF3